MLTHRREESCIKCGYKIFHETSGKSPMNEPLGLKIFCLVCLRKISAELYSRKSLVVQNVFKESSCTCMSFRHRGTLDYKMTKLLQEMYSQATAAPLFKSEASFETHGRKEIHMSEYVCKISEVCIEK